MQLPPNWRANPDRLQRFFEVAPSRHRWAIEFRDPDWLQERVYDILRQYQAALVLHDRISNHPEVVTADWVYLRYHGVDGGEYPYQKMIAEAQRVQDHLTDGLDVYAFFNNDAHARAIKNVRQLMRYVEAE